jgi:hypothetical protein
MHPRAKGNQDASSYTALTSMIVTSRLSAGLEQNTLEDGPQVAVIPQS